MRETTEAEPNEDGSPSTGGGSLGNDFGTALANGPFVGPATITGQLSPAGDEDVFAFDNPGAPGAATRIRLEIWNAAHGVGAPCPPAEGYDPVLVIRDAAGTVLAANDDRVPGQDFCSTVEVDFAPGQRLYGQVVEFNDDQPLAPYLLIVTYLAP